MINNFKSKLSRYSVIIVLCIAVVNLTGCATRAAYFKLDPSLQQDVRSFRGTQYIPLIRLCDAYGINCKWDSFIKTATIQKGPDRIILRTGSGTILVNGLAKKLDRPAVLKSGAIFVPLSFARNNLGPTIAYRPSGEAPSAPEAPKRFAIKAIVIDPGHGGRDVGAIGRRYRLREKDMALTLARRLRDILEGRGVKVIMTRDDDTFIPLPKRAEIANRSGADLFVSVHLNASRSRLMRGFECYFLSNATDDNARALEAFEDSSLRTGEEASAEHSQRLDKTLWDMTLTENRLESAELAGYICDSIEESFTIGNRGVRAARFYVLKHTHIPAVLVEGGYISNRYDELKLKEPEFLCRIAEVVANGILRYKKEYENTEGFTKT